MEFENEFNKKVFRIIDFTFGGFHNFPGNKDSLHWGASHVSMNIKRSLATYDAECLTCLVILCHDELIRLEIYPCNMIYIKLYFHPRTKRDGKIYETMPTIETQIKRIRKSYGKNESKT